MQHFSSVESTVEQAELADLWKQLLITPNEQQVCQEAEVLQRSESIEVKQAARRIERQAATLLKEEAEVLRKATSLHIFLSKP